jgi:hypothetical protein
MFNLIEAVHMNICIETLHDRPLLPIMFMYPLKIDTVKSEPPKELICPPLWVKVKYVGRKSTDKDDPCC